MDLNELKKLINEEVKRTRQRNLKEGDDDEGKTGSGYGAAGKAPKPKIVAEPEPFIPEEPETFKDSLKDATPQELQSHKQRLFKELFSQFENNHEELFKLFQAPNLDPDISNTVSDLLFVYSKLNKKFKDIDTSGLPQNQLRRGLPFNKQSPEEPEKTGKTQWDRDPNKISEPTAAMEPADAPTKKTYPSVEPIGTDEPTKTKARR